MLLKRIQTIKGVKMRYVCIVLMLFGFGLFIYSNVQPETNIFSKVPRAHISNDKEELCTLFNKLETIIRVEEEASYNLPDSIVRYCNLP